MTYKDKQKKLVYQREWRAENKEIVSEKYKLYKVTNLEKIRKQKKLSNEKYKNNNPEKFREVWKKSRNKHKDKIRETIRIWNMNNKDKLKNWTLQWNYGITLINFKEILEKQNNLCAICEIVMDKPFVDHCHVTGIIRGLLCSKCNFGIGLFQENPKIVESAAAYLRRHGKS